MISLGVLACIIPMATFGYFYAKVNSIFEETSAININGNSSNGSFITNDAIISDNITNILLIGTDARDTSERGRSDAMIIATIDEKHQSIKLTSLARDTYVEIPGYDKHKLNHAYSYGGTTLLMNTIEHNLSIDISNYAIVDFNSFSSIIDALGGVNVEVKESEIKELNKYIPECFEANTNKKYKNIELIENPGLQTLNGYQALSYSRIRKNDSSIERDNRQRKVIQAIMDEVSDISVLEIPKLINSVLPYMKTDMDFTTILNIGKKILKMGNFNLEQLTFPMQEYSKNSRIAQKGDVIEFEKDKCLPLLHQFIFEDEDFLKENEVYNSYLYKESELDSDEYDSFESWLNEMIENPDNDSINNDSINDDSDSSNSNSNNNSNNTINPEDYFNDYKYDYNLEYNDSNSSNNLYNEYIPFI